MHVPSVENPGHGLRFCIPVRLDGKNTVARQHDIGPSKYCFDNLRIIFAGYADQDSLVSQGTQQLLVETMKVSLTVEIPGHSLGTNFSGKASPECVVQIRNQALLWRWRRQELS